jgi:hypothetical protein
MNTTMAKTIKIILCLIATIFMTACETTSVSTFESAKDTFADARSTWKAGTSTYAEMVAKYGNPSNKVDIENGFAARWLEKRTITKTPPAYGTANPVRSFENELNHPMNVMSITTALEAFYNKYGVLTNFRIQVLEQ